MTEPVGAALAGYARAAATHGRPTPPRAAIAALLDLARWPNALLAAGGVVVGAWWCAPDAWRTVHVAWAMAAALAITASLNAANDLADVDIDRVAHPERPLVTGALGRPAARATAAVGAVAAVAAGWAAGGWLALATPVVIGAGLAYSRWAAPLGVWGNGMVAAIASLPFLYGAAATGRPGPALALVAIAAPLHFAREVAKDVADMEGDRLAGRRTLPLTRGVGGARLAAIVAVALWLAAISFLLAAAGWRLAFLAPAAGVAIGAAVLVGGPSPARPPRLLKLSMLLAMAALPLLR